MDNDYRFQLICSYIFSVFFSRLSDFYFDGDYFCAPEDLIFSFTPEEMDLLSRINKGEIKFNFEGLIDG